MDERMHGASPEGQGDPARVGRLDTLGTRCFRRRAQLFSPAQVRSCSAVVCTALFVFVSFTHTRGAGVARRIYCVSGVGRTLAFSRFDPRPESPHT